MTAVETRSRFTRTELNAMPDDGRRYELLDGSIVVSASPGGPHQRVVTRLVVALDAAAPDSLYALVGPFDVELPTGDVLVPDLIVAVDEAIGERDLIGLPLLAVEVISPSSRRRDLGDKLTAYRDAGVPSYWVVDPVAPRLQAWSLRDGQYVEVADVLGGEEWSAVDPFEVTLRPSDLVR